MEIRLLNDDYLKSPLLYKDFLEDRVGYSDSHFSDKTIILNDWPDFPIYINVSEGERLPLFLQAFDAIGGYYLNIDRDFHLDGQFWYSLLLLQKREFLIDTYPKIIEDEKQFYNIVLKKFDWENYIYKCVLATEYINDNVADKSERHRYYELVVENLDVFNYIIKYEIFRNDKFLVNVLDIIDENGLSKILKEKLKDRPDLGDDERVGRRVIYELNKSYPVVLAPTLEKDELQVLFLEHLEKYRKYESKDKQLNNLADAKKSGFFDRLFSS